MQVNSETSSLILKIASLLEGLCKKNDEITARKVVKDADLFDCKNIPTITIQAYLERLCQRGGCRDSTLVVMVIYIDSLSKASVDVTTRNIHRALLATFLVATKTYSDVFYNNKYYASVGGVCLKDLNALEAAFLGLMEWKTNVDQEFARYRDGLMKRDEPPAPPPASAPQATPRAEAVQAAAYGAAGHPQPQYQAYTAPQPPPAFVADCWHVAYPVRSAPRALAVPAAKMLPPQLPRPKSAGHLSCPSSYPTSSASSMSTPSGSPSSASTVSTPPTSTPTSFQRTSFIVFPYQAYPVTTPCHVNSWQ
ncbi:Cyclin-U4-1 [Diplonema papillatum]|nr:Cyclin-U4-1 [Diplonema papillatum]